MTKLGPRSPGDLTGEVYDRVRAARAPYTCERCAWELTPVELTFTRVCMRCCREAARLAAAQSLST